MYKLLLVDDRIDIIETIEKVVDWASLDIEIVGKATDGVMALSIIEENTPHIVITDIKMPNMDGIELTKNIRELGKDIEVVILSGYDEFNYAKQAMQLGAKDYLLKPVKVDKLMQLVTKIKEEIIKKEQEQNKYITLKKRVVESKPLLQAEFFNQIIKDPNLDKVKVGERLTALGIDMEVEGFRVMALSWDNLDKEGGLALNMGEDLLTFSAINIMEEVIGKQFKKIIFKKDTEIICVCNRLLEPDDAINIAKEWSRNIKNCLRHGITIGIGRYYKEPKDIINSYDEAKEAVENRFILGGNKVIYINDIHKNYSGDFKYSPQKINRLLEYIKIGKIEMVNEAYKEFIDEFYNNDALPAKEIKRHIIGNVTLLHNELINEQIDLNTVLGNQEDAFNNLGNIKTLEELDIALNNIIKRVTSYIEGLNQDNDMRQIKDIIKYIDTHYTDPEISLGEISKQFFLSISFLSILLKENLGETFSEYIRRLRIEKAKLMLIVEDNKVYEIAESVGYTDRRHFSEVFKKYTGMTPKQYIDKYKSR